MERKTENLFDLFAEEEERRLAAEQTPEAQAAWEEQLARISARAKEEHDKGVRLGWFDEDGNSLLPDDEDEDEEEDEE